MAEPREQKDLFPARDVADGTVAVNDRCLLRTQAGHRVVVVAGIVLAQYELGDRMADRIACYRTRHPRRRAKAAFMATIRRVRRHEEFLRTGGGCEDS